MGTLVNKLFKTAYLKNWDHIRDTLMSRIDSDTLKWGFKQAFSSRDLFMMKKFEEIYGSREVLIMSLCPDLVAKYGDSSDINMFADNADSVNLSWLYKSLEKYAPEADYTILSQILNTRLDIFNETVLSNLVSDFRIYMKCQEKPLYTILDERGYKSTNTGSKFKVFMTDTGKQSIITIPSNKQKTTEELFQTFVGSAYEAFIEILNKVEGKTCTIVVYFRDSIPCITVLNGLELYRDTAKSFQKTRSAIKNELSKVDLTTYDVKLGFGVISMKNGEYTVINSVSNIGKYI